MHSKLQHWVMKITVKWSRGGGAISNADPLTKSFSLFSSSFFNLMIPFFV